MSKTVESNHTERKKGPWEPSVERRSSIVQNCLVCDPKQRCSLSRAEWFQQIRTVLIAGRQATIFRQGERADKVYALRRGWLQATHIMPNGKAITDLFGPGSILGVDCAAAQCEFPYTVVTIEDCELEEADSDEFLRRLGEDPLLAMDVVRQVSRNMQRLLSRFYASSSKVSSTQLLLETLKEISCNCSTSVDNSAVRINVPLSVQVLADHIGCSRQWVSKILANLEKEGVVRRNGVWITIEQEKRSKRLASLDS